jgi:hypothetical protein
VDPNEGGASDPSVERLLREARELRDEVTFQ